MSLFVNCCRAFVSEHRFVEGVVYSWACVMFYFGVLRHNSASLQTGRDKHYYGPAVRHGPLPFSHILELVTEPVYERGTNDGVQDTLGHQYVKYDISQD